MEPDTSEKPGEGVEMAHEAPAGNADGAASTSVESGTEAAAVQSDAPPVKEAEGEAPIESSVAEEQGGTPDEPGDEGQQAPSAPATPESHLKWYAVHTYSGHENKARLSLLERIKNANLDDEFGEILIPTESVVEMVKGRRRTTTRKFYPGYMFVQMQLSDETLHLVKNTPKITGFLGGNKPVPVKDDEIAGINRQMTEGAAKPRPRVSFEEGENIRVVDGPFSNFTGIVEEVRPEKQKVRVLVSIFGRATPVELDFVQVEKA